MTTQNFLRDFIVIAILLWIPTLCLCLFLVLEARFHIREKLCYSVCFWKKGTRRLVFFAGGCLGVCLLVWYGYRINQMLFRQEYYQPVLEEYQVKETGTGLQIPWMVERDYVVSQNQKQEKIFPFSRQKIYFQFRDCKIEQAGEERDNGRAEDKASEEINRVGKIYRTLLAVRAACRFQAAKTPYAALCIKNCRPPLCNQFWGTACSLD